MSKKRETYMKVLQMIDIPKGTLRFKLWSDTTINSIEEYWDALDSGKEVETHSRDIHAFALVERCNPDSQWIPKRAIEGIVVDSEGDLGLTGSYGNGICFEEVNQPSQQNHRADARKPSNVTRSPVARVAHDWR